VKRKLPHKSLLKRAVDIAIAVTGLILMSPLMLLIGLLIRVGLGSPTLFRQKRPGFRGRPFTLYKFRTMLVETRNVGVSDSDAVRLTRLGRVLRSTSLDELPELWNVIRGDMSIVGPRPLLMEYLPLYTDEQARRHEAKPGITGLSQVSGRNALQWEERFRLDVWYVDHWSLGLDARILLRTIAKVVRMEGISASGRATMEPFRGGTRVSAAD
jgi:lipopolysaccharide/colanic/teichoic acid biosynthesis glycosyltransferase